MNKSSTKLFTDKHVDRCANNLHLQHCIQKKKQGLTLKDLPMISKQLYDRQKQIWLRHRLKFFFFRRSNGRIRFMRDDSVYFYYTVVMIKLVTFSRPQTQKVAQTKAECILYNFFENKDFYFGNFLNLYNCLQIQICKNKYEQTKEKILWMKTSY